MAKWATKNPPKKKGRYLITVRTNRFIDPCVMIADRVEYPSGHWYWSAPPIGTYYDSNVTAWQKCPEPYKGE